MNRHRIESIRDRLDRLEQPPAPADVAARQALDDLLHGRRRELPADSETLRTMRGAIVGGFTAGGSLAAFVKAQNKRPDLGDDVQPIDPDLAGVLVLVERALDHPEHFHKYE